MRNNCQIREKKTRSKRYYYDEALKSMLFQVSIKKKILEIYFFVSEI